MNQFTFSFKHTGILCLCTILAGIVLMAATVSAQPANRSGMAVHGGDIIGMIESCSASLAGVEVYIPGHSFQAKAAQDGKFKLHYVQPGSYTVVVARSGEVLTSLQNVVVTKNRVTDAGTISICADTDADGFDESVDCNDANPFIFPGAEELCDGLDNNCDGTVDEGCPDCTDSDSDGFFAQEGCGTVVDCDDENSAINPGANEICFDSIDNNCDGTTDENCLTCTPGDACATGSVGVCTQGVFDSTCTCVSLVGPSEEICNDGLDNDCDGDSDEAACVCSGGLTNCNGDCVDLTTDSAHCGTCNAQCDTGVACSQGSCAVSCVPDCSGAFCGDDGCGGSCGSCPSGKTCSNKICVSQYHL